MNRVSRHVETTGNSLQPRPLLRAKMESTLRYLGHAAFLWTGARGSRALIDPFRNPERGRWFVRPFPRVHADILMVTHDHFDHNAVEMAPGSPEILAGQGGAQREDLTVLGIAEVHSRAPEINMVNTIFRVEAGGVSYCHLGDNRPDIAPQALEQLGQIDVLMVPVDDSRHLLRFEEVAALIESIDPRVIIPMHYFTHGTTHEDSTLLSIDEWLSLQPSVKRIRAHTLTMSPKALPQKPRKAPARTDASLPPEALAGKPEVWVMDPWLP